MRFAVDARRKLEPLEGILIYIYIPGSLPTPSTTTLLKETAKSLLLPQCKPTKPYAHPLF